MSETMMNPIEESEEQQDQYAGFQITDDSMAEWAVQKIKDAQSDTTKWKAHFDAQLAAIQKNNDDTVNAMTVYLAHYFTTVPHRETKTQAKYELPSATLIRKQHQPQYERDNDVLLDYLDGNRRSDLIRIKREPAWDEIKQTATVQGEALVDADTGEIIPGVRVIARPDTFDVKIKEV